MRNRYIRLVVSLVAALAAIPAGTVAGQKLWPGEYLLPPMVKDNPVTLPVPISVCR